MKRFLFSLHLAFAAILFASAPSQAVAQSDSDFQPGVVIALAHIDEHLSDIEHLMEAAGVGQMSGLVRMAAAEYIRGIDADKPIGALLFFNEDNPEEPDVMAFVPVTDFEDVLDTLAPFVDIDEDGDDIVLTANDGTEITTRVVDGFAFLAKDAAMLANLPEDPTSLLGDLHSQYNIAARVFGQNIPESLRQQAIELIKSGADAEMSNLGDGPEAELQRANFEYSMSQMESFINETEEVVAGLAIDEDGKRIYIDVKVVGLADSPLAKQSNEFPKGPATEFGGFLMDDAAATFHLCGKLLDDDIKQIQKLVDNLESAAQTDIDKDTESGEMSDDEADGAKKVLGKLVNVLRGSIDKGYMDGGGALVLDGEHVQFAMGLSIAEGAALEASVKEIATWAEADFRKKKEEELSNLKGQILESRKELAKLKPGKDVDETSLAKFAAKEEKIQQLEKNRETVQAKDPPFKFNFDVSSENGVRYHKVQVQVPESEEELRKMFGEEVEILLGVGDEVLYAAAGHDPKDILAKCIAGKAVESDKELVGQFNMRLLPILKFLSQVQDAPELNGIADILPDDADDRIRMTVRVIPNGQHFRFEVEDAILKVLTEIGQSMGGGFGPPQDF